jgi:hypothetical protein
MADFRIDEVEVEVDEEEEEAAHPPPLVRSHGEDRQCGRRLQFLSLVDLHLVDLHLVDLCRRYPL